MHFNQIKETSLYVKDLDRTEAFYSGKLQLEVIGKEEGRHIFFKSGFSILLCFIADKTKAGENLPSHYGEGNMHIAFEVPKEEYEATKAWLQSRGIEIEHEQSWGRDFKSCYFRDPDGHSLEIVPSGMWD
ncbi:VOC family protein [Aliifodinibius sp. S!AR15-10]|uniref:VOC family protein n=1 Tax=Aliifodinibius sp. S!AR15-10 TaxID=2950437 RepID=UPI00285B7F68|nr:VOC family protein [Aliifodinibius sp. S!AR15-10]MDR8392992.1 VOC family protein [Aliifodinibius sp. S!AR15-10]